MGLVERITALLGEIKEANSNPSMLASVFRACNELVKQGAIKGYALGGGMGSNFYTEPVSTFDADVFYIPATSSFDADLSTIYSTLQQRMGASIRGERIMINGIPAQFLAADALAAEGVENCEFIRVGPGLVGRVMAPEYLAALALRLGRNKDKARVDALRASNQINEVTLSQIMARHRIR